MQTNINRLLCAVSLVAALSMHGLASAAEPKNAETKYLLFQIFNYSGTSKPQGTPFLPPQGQINSAVQDVIDHIGCTGSQRAKLGFVVGPITFNHSDDDVRRMIKDSFRIAKEKNVAVAFHIDDSMFWDCNSELAKDKNNIEWIDWQGTPCSGRKLEWGPEPAKAAPQMCLNSAAVKAAVSKRAQLIGGEIAREVADLKAANKTELFAGVIAGWETMFGRDFATNRSSGFHSLKNRGLSSANSSKQCDAELIATVKEFIELWARGLTQAGIPPSKIYAHVAFTPQGLGTVNNMSFEQQVGYATPEVAFSKWYRPGFSTYPMEGVLEQVTSEVAKRGGGPWCSAEGTNVVPNGMQGEATMETYLAKMFNHGATMVNIFSWGIGGDSQKDNFFRRATEGPEALSSYRKFLTDKPLIVQERSVAAFSPVRFREKVGTIQEQVPKYVQRTHRVDVIQLLMVQLDGYIKNNQFESADKLADQILKLVSTK